MLASLIALTGAAAARTWTLVDVGTLGGPGSYGAAISNAGLVVGCADLPGGGAHAFVYESGVMRDLDAGAKGSSCALAVNNAGLAAGRSTIGELVIWNATSVTHLGISGDVGAIDANGVVVGTLREGTSTFAFKYENGAVVSLGAGSGSSASGINSRGQIAGTSNGRAFLYRSGAIIDLGTLGGSRSSARGLNDQGQVVGMSPDTTSQPRPFLFDGAMRTLPGPSYSGAVAINNRAQIVGSGEGTYGYLLEGETYTRLDTLPVVVTAGWRHLEPTGINDRGWIVGTGTAPSGDLRAFILIPSEERAPVAAVARLGRGSG